MEYININFIIFDVTELPNINFTEVLQNYNATKSRYGL
jgi:hypothetical protein